MAKRSYLSTAKRREAVLSLLRREEAASVLARRYGVSEGSLYRWRDEFLVGGKAVNSMAASIGEIRIQKNGIKTSSFFITEPPYTIGNVTDTLFIQTA